MLKPKKVLILSFLIAGLTHPIIKAFSENTDKMVNFLLDELVVDGNQRFQGVEGKLPTSYLSNNISYWGDYVCKNEACTVEDVVSTSPFSIVGNEQKNPAGSKLQLERAFTTYGANIYDTATWQIAAALGMTQGQYGHLTFETIEEIIHNQNKRFSKWQTKATPCAAYDPLLDRCDPQKGGNGYIHGYGNTATVIENLEYAYSFRMFGPDFLYNEPFYNTSYLHYVSFDKYYDLYHVGEITWADWKPISGENGWGFLLGPLQSQFLINKKTGETFTKNMLALRNAMNFIRGLQRMQSEIGAIYYATNGSQGNTGLAVPAGEISVENNVSILAGLNLLKNILSTLPADPEVQDTINVINIMIWGGTMPNGETTSGILNYLKAHGYNKDEGVFSQGGTYVKGSYSANDKDFALDVNTWGISALGPKTLDAWYGSGTAYKIWKKARDLAGYCQGDNVRDPATGACKPGSLWGVGYTRQRESDITIDGKHYDQQVMSSEWTAGAINTVKTLTEYYAQNPGLSDAQKQELASDLKSMNENLLKLQTDRYFEAQFSGSEEAKNYLSKDIPSDEVGYLYASRRYSIPFGWYANPIPNTASTAWPIMLEYKFDPFRYNGKPNDYTDGQKPSYDSSAFHINHDPGLITIINKVQDYHPEDVTIVEYTRPIKVYSQEGTDPDLHYIDIIYGGSYGEINLTNVPAGRTLLFNYPDNVGERNACIINVDFVRNAIKGKDPIHTVLIVQGHADQGQPCTLITG